MPLLFWLAGSACWYALQRRTGKQFVKERVSRLLIPLVAGLLLIVPPQGYYALKMHGSETADYWTFLINYYTDFSDLSGYFGSFTPAHLWFILYLFVLSLLALPLLQRWVKHVNDRDVQATARVLSHPLWFALLFIPLAALQALPAPGGQNPFFYLFLLLAGFMVCTDARFMLMIEKVRSIALIVCMVTVPLWLWMLSTNRGVPDFSASMIAMTLLRTLNVWLTLVVIVGYGKKLLNFHHRWLDYANEAAFPVYIIHQTLIVVIGYYVLPLHMPIFIQFTLVMTASFAASLFLYELLMKRFTALRWLFGIKAPHRPSARQRPRPSSNAPSA